MREILFRGKCKDNSGWVYGVPVLTIEKRDGRHDFSKRTIIMPVQSLVIDGKSDEYEFDGSMMFYDELPQEVIPETVGQFTGLYDRNGNKVFEGDVLQFRKSDGSAPYKRTATIAYGSWNCNCCDGIYGWYSEGQDCIRGLYETSDEIEGTSGYVIIGNIHDNPELVKEETK